MLESEERYRRLSEMMTDYAFSFKYVEGEGFVADWVAGSIEKITGYSEYEIFYSPIDTRMSIYHPHDLESVRADMEETQRGKKTQSEYRILTKSGEIRWLLIHREPIWDEVHQQVISYYGTGQDITERKQAQEALRKSEKKYRILIENHPEFINRWDPSDGRFIFVNESYCKHINKTRDEFLGRSIFDSSPPELRESIKDRVLQNIQLLTPENPVTHSEEPGIGGDGKMHWYSWRARAIFDEAGQIIEVQSIGRDITDRKQAEEALRESENRYKTLFENVPISIYTKDLDGRYTSTNTENLLYFPKNPLGYTDFDLSPVEIAEPLRVADLQVIETGQELSLEEQIYMSNGLLRTVQSRKVPLRDANGEIIGILGASLDITERKQAVQSRKVPLRDANGEIIGILGASLDITERKQAEENLKLAKATAETANRAKSLFLSNMSHELRTPLNSTLGFAQIMKRDATILPKHGEHLEFIINSGEHLLKSINSILDMSRIDTGQIGLDEQDLDLHHLLDNWKLLVQERCNNKGLELRFEIVNTVPRYIHIDGGKLHQVLHNLITNAIKSTDKGVWLF